MSVLIDPRGEVERLVKIIKEAEPEKLRVLDIDETVFLGRCMLKLQSQYSKFSDKEVYWLRDIRDKTL